MGCKRKCVVDEISLLSREPSFATLGIKTRLQLAAAHLAPMGLSINVLVDREWDHLDLDNLQEPLPESPNADLTYITKGHSIENYWFTEKAVISYLKLHYGGVLRGEFFEALASRFVAMLKLAVAFSLAARKLQAITQVGGLVRHVHVDWANQEYVANAALSTAAGGRGIQVDLATETLGQLRRRDLGGLSQDALRWLCHGHLGEQVIRACAANLASEMGYEKLVDPIERGFQEIKLAHDADWLAKQDKTATTPLDRLVNWAA